MTKSRMLLNIFLTFIISGLWHGISFPFLLWGCCHGVLVCIEKFLCLSSDSMTSVCKMLYRLFVVIVTMQLWQLFRFKNIGELLEYSKRMFINSEFKGQIIVSLLIAVVSLFVIENRCIKSLVFSMATSKNHIICEVSLLALMLALLLLCPYKYTFNFFYFNF